MSIGKTNSSGASVPEMPMSNPTDINARAIEYMGDYMDMHEPMEDQDQNITLRHLCQFAESLMGADVSEHVSTRTVKLKVPEGDANE